MGPGPAGEVGGFLKKRGYCRSFISRNEGLYTTMDLLLGFPPAGQEGSSLIKTAKMVREWYGRCHFST